MKKALIISLSIIALAIIGMLFIAPRPRPDEWSRSTPNQQIRNAVAGVLPSDIAAVRLDVLPDMLVIVSEGTAIPKKLPLMEGYPYTVHKNSDAIALLLKGLQEATSPSECRMNKINHIVLLLKNKRVIGPFGFGRGIRVDYFSPTFIEGLKQAGVKNIPHH